MPEIFAYLTIFSYLCRSNRDATATSALRSPSTTLYLIINPIYLPLKHNDYEQNMEDNSADYWLRHCRHPRCSRWGDFDV